MADTTTANYGLTKVEVGTSQDTWGAKLNGNWDAVDAAVKAVADTVGTKLAASAFTAAAVLAMLQTLDADTGGVNASTLDGKEAADFLLASAFTAAAVTALLQTVDGAGSGIDADLLDGQHAAAFALAAHVHNYLGLAGGTITGQLLRQGAGAHLFLAADGMDAGGRVYITDEGAADPTSQPGDIWIALAP